MNFKSNINMKKCLFLFSLLLFLSACNQPLDDYPEPVVGSYAYGADCSWITEQEADGVLFYDTLGRAADGMRVMREVGMNSVRLRVWVNHTTGWCNKEDVIIKAADSSVTGFGNGEDCLAFLDNRSADNIVIGSKVNTINTRTVTSGRTDILLGESDCHTVSGCKHKLLLACAYRCL